MTTREELHRKRCRYHRLRLQKLLEFDAPDVIIKRSTQTLLESLYGGTWRAAMGLIYNRLWWQWQSLRDDAVFAYQRHILGKSDDEIFGAAMDDIGERKR